MITFTETFRCKTLWTLTMETSFILFAHRFMCIKWKCFIEGISRYIRSRGQLAGLREEISINFSRKLIFRLMWEYFSSVVCWQNFNSKQGSGIWTDNYELFLTYQYLIWNSVWFGGPKSSKISLDSGIIFWWSKFAVIHWLWICLKFLFRAFSYHEMQLCQLLEIGPVSSLWKSIHMCIWSWNLLSLLYTSSGVIFGFRLWKMLNSWDFCLFEPREFWIFCHFWISTMEAVREENGPTSTTNLERVKSLSLPCRARRVSDAYREIPRVFLRGYDDYACFPTAAPTHISRKLVMKPRWSHIMVGLRIQMVVW